MIVMIKDLTTTKDFRPTDRNHIQRGTSTNKETEVGEVEETKGGLLQSEELESDESATHSE